MAAERDPHGPAARVNVAGRELTVVTTHLVRDPAEVQMQQAAELLDGIDAQAMPVLLVGDFNSAANPGAPAEDRTGTYAMLLNAGFIDLWDRGDAPKTSGSTSCFSTRDSAGWRAMHARSSSESMRTYTACQTRSAQRKPRAA